MKIPSFKILLLSCSIASASAQTVVTIKPGPGPGQDALIATNTFCPWATTNSGNHPELNAMTWTYTGQGCDLGTTRSLLRFTQLNTLVPSTAMVTSVTLRLYGLPTSGNPGNTANNEMLISRVTSAWDESTVTWNTAPSTTAVNQILTPASASQWNWNYTDNSANLLAMVQHMVTFPNENFGFLLQLASERPYRAMQFASSDHPDSRLWPELIVTYVDCFPHFTISSSSMSNGIFTFTSPITHPSAIHEWYYYGPNGYAPLGTLPSVNTTFNQPGTYQICHHINLPTTKCRTCIDICTNGTVASPDNNAPDAGKVPPGYAVMTQKAGIQQAAPNPTDKDWTVNFLAEREGSVQAIVVDILNRKVLDKRISIQKGTNAIRIEGGNLAPGQYILNMQTQDGKWSTKLVKY